jgi:hypothetical protein
MNNKIFRVTIAIVLGVTVSLCTIQLVEWIDTTYLSKMRLDNSWTYEDKLAYIKKLPTSAFVLKLIAYLLSSFFGSYTAARISNHLKFVSGLAVGFFMILGCIMDVIVYSSQPIWYIISSFLVVLAITYVGSKVGGRVV